MGKQGPDWGAGGLNVYGFVGNAVIHNIDVYGLMRVTISVEDVHGSIEVEVGEPGAGIWYIITDWSGRDANVTRRHGSIFRSVIEGTQGGTIQAAESSTFVGLTTYMFMTATGLQVSSSVKGTVTACDKCCRSGKIRLQWKSSASYSAGANASDRGSDAWIVNNETARAALATKSNPSDTKSGYDDIATDVSGCIHVGYGVGAGWIDRDSTVSTRSTEKVVFTVTCAP